MYISIPDEGILWVCIFHFWHVVPQAFHGVAAFGANHDPVIRCNMQVIPAISRQVQHIFKTKIDELDEEFWTKD